MKDRIHTYLVDLTNKRAIYDVAKEVHNDLGRVVRRRRNHVIMMVYMAK